MISTQIARRTIVATALLSALAACGGGGGSNSSNNPPPTVVTTAQEDKFGIGFGTAFRAPANGEPANVSDGDLVPVSFTTEPIDITP